MDPDYQERKTNMTANNIVAQIWQRARADAVFRRRLLAAPEETLSAEGFNLDDENVESFVGKLKGADVDALNRAFDSDDPGPTC
jgi:hypothetical protein